MYVCVSLFPCFLPTSLSYSFVVFQMQPHTTWVGKYIDWLSHLLI